MLKSYSPLDKEKVHVYGRTCPKNQEILPLFWTASGIEFQTDSSEVWLETESVYELRETWIRMEVDGVCMQRYIVPKGRNCICVFRGFTRDQIRTIRILRETQPTQEDSDSIFLIHTIICDGTLYKVEQKRFRLEFVGDSLSSGEGLSGPVRLVSSCAGVFGLEGHYAICTADNLQADFRILSQSGWGVYCAWNNSLEEVMPRYYEQVCGILNGSRNIGFGAQEHNDFSAWKPDAVVINLGSNDGFALGNPAWINPVDKKAWKQCITEDGHMDQASTERFETAVISFLGQVRKNNPGAWIIWAYGMIDHIMEPYLEEAIRIYKEQSNDRNVEWLCLPAGKEEWLGSNNHPGSRTHSLAACVLTKELKKRLFHVAC